MGSCRFSLFLTELAICTAVEEFLPPEEMGSETITPYEFEVFERTGVCH